MKIFDIIRTFRDRCFSGKLRKTSGDLGFKQVFAGSDLEAMRRLSDKVFASVPEGRKIDLLGPE